MKLSNYKKKKLKGFLLSLLSMGVGALLLKHFMFPVAGVPFLIFGGFGSFFFLIYFISEYEEDLADSRTLSDITSGHVNGLSTKRQPQDKS